MDIIFVNAIYFWYEESINIGQFILRDILKDEYEVECINFDYLDKVGEINYTKNFNENIILMGNYLIEKNPKIIGFYTICNAFIITVKLAEYIRKMNPEIKIIFGGPQATLIKDECFKAFDFIDVVCMGESEYSIKPLITVLLNGGDLSKIPGIAYMSDNQLIATDHSELIKSEDLFKYVVYDFSPFKIDRDNAFTLEGGRGCPYSCTFCSTSKFWKRAYRVKSVDNLINEMKKLNQLYGVSKFSIQHDMFTANRKYICEFCNRLIEEKLTYEWYCSSRIDALDNELIDLMRKSNCYGIYIGVETGSKRMQNIINKNLNIDGAIDMINYINDSGLEVTTSFVYCFPDETIEDFKETINLIEKFIYAGIYNTQLHRFMALPGTIETGKIINEMYYDSNVVDTTMNIIKLNGSIKDMIKKYPIIFSQYYTFDSVVKDKYKRFDTFIEGMSVMNQCYNNCIKILIDLIGLETMYFELENKLDKLYIYAQNINMDERAHKDLTYDTRLFHEIFIEFITSKANTNDVLYKEVLKYDNYRYMYSIGGVSKPVIIRFDINIEKAISDHIIEHCEYYIKYSLRNGKVYTTHVIPKKPCYT